MSDEAATHSHVWVPLASGAVRITVVWPTGSAQHVPQTGRPVLLGRGSEVDIAIPHESVSRVHARIVCGAECTIEDLGSRNGVRVGGRILSAGETASFAQGEVIEVGKAMVVVQGGNEPPTAPGTHSGLNFQRMLTLVAKSSLCVMILGETGTGKEVTAREVHGQSSRPTGPFVAVNCAALTEALLESELFGYEKGAFTGALSTKLGLIEAANGGTLFLDEVGEMPLATQAKLLRVLETHEIRRVGANTSIRVDVRFVAATNKNLDEMVAEGTFRSDLYFRLDGVKLRLLPLRDRPHEIPGLTATFLGEIAARAGTPTQEVTAQARSQLMRHAWPGNVRELRNVLERASVFAQGGVIDAEHLGLDVRPDDPSLPKAADGLPAAIGALELQRIQEALTQFRGNQTRAAEALGISRRTLINRMEEHRIPRPRKGKR